MPLLRAVLSADSTPPAGPDSSSRIGVSAAACAGGEAAARDHDPQRRAGREIVHALVEPPQIFGDERLHVGIRDGRRHALVFADLARDAGRDRHGELRKALADRRGDLLLVRVVHVSVEQAHRDRVDVEAFEIIHQALELGVGERLHDFAARVEALVDFAALVQRRERLRESSG